MVDVRVPVNCRHRSGPSNEVEFPGPRNRLGDARAAARRASPLAGIALGLALGAPAVLGALDIGAIAPDFDMATLDGRRFSFAEAQKSHAAVVVLFISTICPYSNYYKDLIRDMATEYSRKGIAFVGVNSGTLEAVEEVRRHAREHGHTFAIIKDPDARIADCWERAAPPRRSSSTRAERCATAAGSPRSWPRPT